jgi:hypothetical protein
VEQAYLWGKLHNLVLTEIYFSLDSEEWLWLGASCRWGHESTTQGLENCIKK